MVSRVHRLFMMSQEAFAIHTLEDSPISRRRERGKPRARCERPKHERRRVEAVLQIFMEVKLVASVIDARL